MSDFPPCSFDGFENLLTGWINDDVNKNATFGEFVSFAEQIILVNCDLNTNDKLESQLWCVDDKQTLLVINLTQEQEGSEILHFRGKWPNGVLGSTHHFSRSTKNTTTFLREGKVVNNPDSVKFTTNKTSTNYMVLGEDGETVHVIGESIPKCSCSCTSRKSSKKKPSRKSCRRKSSDRRHHTSHGDRSKSHRRGCKNYH